MRRRPVRAEATRRSRQQWFVTVPSVTGTAHVKRLGTGLSACGLPTGGWSVLWESDPSDLPAGCAACAVAMSTEAATTGVATTEVR